MNTDEDIQTAINNAGDIGCTYTPDITESEYRSMSAKSPTPTNPTPNHTCDDFA